ncbi:PilZ domain-containing protein [Virgibacillus necropolis]|uniref:flagellar brake protein n=1 Tax=Virgibacillus necropolis TaxID=163877 RepID=UPI0038504115
MDIGTSLTLSVTDPQTGIDTKYRCKVIEKNEHYLFIDYPVNVKTKRTAILPKNTYIQTSYIESNQSVYSFNTKVIAKVNVNIPALAISIPRETDIKRIQRRSFVRIETAVDVSIHRAKPVSESFATVTSDISGGGMSIILPVDHTLNENDNLDVWIVLQMQNGQYNYIYTQSTVVRVITDKGNIHTASIKFATISKQDQQVIIRYCFEKQRELRTKELK